MHFKTIDYAENDFRTDKLESAVFGFEIDEINRFYFYAFLVAEMRSFWNLNA